MYFVFCLTVWIDKVVPNGWQNTKYKIGRISCFGFWILSLSIVVVDRRQNRLEICAFNFVSFFCQTTKHEIGTKFTHFFVVWSCSVTRQNTKYRRRGSSSFVFCILHFVFCRPLGTTKYKTSRISGFVIYWKKLKFLWLLSNSRIFHSNKFSKKTHSNILKFKSIPSEKNLNCCVFTQINSVENRTQITGRHTQL